MLLALGGFLPAPTNPKFLQDSTASQPVEQDQSTTGSNSAQQSIPAAQDQRKAETSTPDASPGTGQEKAPASTSSQGKETQRPAASPCANGATRTDCNPSVPAPVHKKRRRKPKPVASPDSTATKTETVTGKSDSAESKTGSGPNKTVVRNGGASEGTVELSPGISQQQASQQIQNTTQLLAVADENLKKLSGRQLSSSQLDTVQQIKTYMEQARSAQSAEDLQGAYNLANKAKMLSDELVGQ